MTSIEEFAFIAAQLEWLERRLREQPLAVDPSRMEGALNALACARAVIVQLSNIGSALSDMPSAATPAL
ncbi:MAG: hypothetical protein QFE16_10765 [Pseudomonadota bacterium]|nr:hypothetical protein [Pseudomonadota bacterium]